MTPSLKTRLLYWLTRYPRLFRGILWSTGRLTPELRVMLNSVRRGGVVLDIGANRGYFTQLYSLLVGKRGRVYAFEPVPSTFHLLTARMSTRQVFSNVELVPVGLDDKGGTTTIYLPGGDDGQASLKVHKEAGSWRDGATFESHACQTVRLDDFASDRSLTRLDFVKCDVEGAELLVMRGGAKTLARFQPILYLEVCPQWTVGFGYQPEDLCSFLRSLGYKTFMLVTEDCSRPFSANIEKLRALTKSANLLCLPPEK